MKSKTPIRFALLLLSLLAFFPSLLPADIRLPAIFGDNMVLQRQTDVAVWGKAAANATVRVVTSWNRCIGHRVYHACALDDAGERRVVTAPSELQALFELADQLGL